VRGSFFLSSYELFYTPLPAGQKRAAKPIIDVGVDRLGDALGGIAVQAALWLVPALITPLPLMASFATAIVAFAVTRLLHSGYLGTLKSSLRERASELSIEELEDDATRTIFLASVPGLDVSRILESSLAVTEGRTRDAGDSGQDAARRSREAQSEDRTPASVPPPDPAAARVRDLRSADPVRVRAALLRAGPLDDAAVAPAIALLAWDEVAEEAIRALREVAPHHTGQLVDALLSPTRRMRSAAASPGCSWRRRDSAPSTVSPPAFPTRASRCATSAPARCAGCWPVPRASGSIARRS
jgi:hypothetical protein